jgi:hypothetical protein
MPPADAQDAGVKSAHEPKTKQQACGHAVLAQFVSEPRDVPPAARQLVMSQSRHVPSLKQQATVGSGHSTVAQLVPAACDTPPVDAQIAGVTS